jgi:hypothetical protein
MLAESFARILNERRAAALQKGTFLVRPLGREVSSVNPEARLPIHDNVIRPLLAKAVECRVYGISPRSKLFDLVRQIGQRQERVWRLDVTRELVHGYEPIWNACCEHNGIALRCHLTVPESQPIFAHCSRPDVWLSRYQLCQGTSRAAVAYCFDVARASDDMVFLIPGSNGLEWMDVFANAQILPLLWEQALRQEVGAQPGKSSGN